MPRYCVYATKTVAAGAPAGSWGALTDYAEKLA